MANMLPIHSSSRCFHRLSTNLSFSVCLTSTWGCCLAFCPDVKPLVSWIERGVAVARQGVPYKLSPRDSPICHPFLLVHLGWKYWRGYHIFQYLHTTLESASLIFCQNVAEFLLPVWLGGSGDIGQVLTEQGLHGESSSRAHLPLTGCCAGQGVCSADSPWMIWSCCVSVCIIFTFN